MFKLLKSAIVFMLISCKLFIRVHIKLDWNTWFVPAGMASGRKSKLALSWFYALQILSSLTGNVIPRLHRAINYIDGTIFCEIQLPSFKSNYNLCGLQLIAHWINTSTNFPLISYTHTSVISLYFECSNHSFQFTSICKMFFPRVISLLAI